MYLVVSDIIRLVKDFGCQHPSDSLSAAIGDHGTRVEFSYRLTAKGKSGNLNLVFWLGRGKVVGDWEEILGDELASGLEY